MAWLTDWGHRISVPIALATGAGTDYQVKLTVHSGVGSDAPGVVYLNNYCVDFPNDIRFTDDDGETKLDHFCEDLTADPAIFHVKVDDDLGSNQSIWIYCGKTVPTLTHIASYRQVDNPTWHIDYLNGAQVVGDYAYCAVAVSETLTILDISDPENVAEVSSIACAHAHDIQVVGTVAYVLGSWSDTLSTFDVSNVEAPSLLDSINVGGTGQYLWVEGNYCYITEMDTHCLKIYDISNPSDITFVSSICGATAHLNEPWHLEKVGNYVYITTKTAPYDGISIIDVSDIENPAYAGGIHGESGKYFSLDFRIRGDYLFAGSQASPYPLQIYEITDGGAGLSLYSSTLLRVGGHLDISGNSLYFRDGEPPEHTADNGIGIIDISDLSNPVYVGGIYGAGSPYYLSGCHWMQVVGDKLHTFGYLIDSFAILDIGEVGASSASNGADTFIQYHGAATTTYLDSLDLSGATNFRYRTKIKAGPSGDQNIICGLANALAMADDFGAMQAHAGNDLRYAYAGNEGTPTSVSEAPWWGYATYRIGEILFLAGTKLQGFIDGDQIAGDISTNLPDEAMGLWLWVATGVATQDWSFIAKYVSPEPVVGTAGEWETPPAIQLSVTTSLLIGDSSLRSMLAGLSITDGFESGDTNNPFGMMSRADGLKAGDSLSILTSLLASEGVKLGDSSFILGSLLLSRADGLTAGDNRFLYGMLGILDRLKVGDSPSLLASLLASDGLKIGDTPLYNLLWFLSITDGAKFGDSNLLNFIIPLIVTDGTKLGDSLSILAKLIISDGLELGDSPTRETIANLLRLDGVELGDSATLTGALLYLAIVEGLKPGDTRLIGMQADIQASDGTKIGDSPLAGMLASLLRTDGVKVGDSVSRLVTMLLAATDGVKVGDAQLAEMIADILRADGVTLGDITVAGLTGIIYLSLIEAIKLGDARAIGGFGQLLRIWLLAQPYFDVTMEAKPYYDVSVETRLEEE